MVKGHSWHTNGTFATWSGDKFDMIKYPVLGIWVWKRGKKQGQKCKKRGKKDPKVGEKGLFCGQNDFLWNGAVKKKKKGRYDWDKKDISIQSIGTSLTWKRRYIGTKMTWTAEVLGRFWHENPAYWDISDIIRALYWDISDSPSWTYWDKFDIRKRHYWDISDMMQDIVWGQKWHTELFYWDVSDILGGLIGTNLTWQQFKKSGTFLLQQSVAGF